MITHKDLCHYAQVRSQVGEKSLADLGVSPEIIQGIGLGVDPMKVGGSGWVANVTREIAKAKSREENTRVNNACVAVAKGKPCKHKTAFQSAPDPYTVRAVQKWKDSIQREEELPPVALSLGLKSTGTLKEEIIQSLGHELSMRGK